MVSDKEHVSMKIFNHLLSSHLFDFSDKRAQQTCDTQLN